MYVPAAKGVLLLALLAAPASALLGKARLSRWAVLSGGAATAAMAPIPAFARSKEKAKEKAMQKATASEARQAMKEYKYAPRPELLGNAETGYSYKAGTIQAGSTGELSSYFKEKGTTIQSQYAEDKARAAGKSPTEARRAAQAVEAQARAEKEASLAKKKSIGEDEKRVAAFCKENPDAVDNLGRRQCK